MNPMDVASHICANSWNYFSKITIEDILEGGKSKKFKHFFLNVETRSQFGFNRRYYSKPTIK